MRIKTTHVYMKLMLNFYNKWKRLLFCLSQCSLIQQATMWSPKTTVSISVICGAFFHMLTEKLAAGELTLHFSVYLTLCHTDKKALRYLFVGLLTIKITDLLFSKNSYARDLSIIFPKYNPVLRWFWLFTSLPLAMFFLFSVTWT